MLTDVIIRHFPVPGTEITCGSRTWLYRRLRVHLWVPLGFDTANKGTEGICEVLVYACWTCGKDKRD